MRVPGTFAAILIVFATSGTPVGAQAGRMTCGLAVSRLQEYVVNVNTFANGEFFQGIPMRCGWNQWCRTYWYGQLNAWYGQQATMVNSWYRQLVDECTAEDYKPRKKRVDLTKPTEDDAGGLDAKAVEELEVDEADKTIRIKIPTTAAGYRRDRP